MDRRQFATPGSPIGLDGRDTGRPVLLVIPGLFAKPEAFSQLQLSLPAVDVWRAFLPGPENPSIPQFAAGLRLPDRPFAVLGFSAGAVAALHLSSPHLRHQVLVEPVLRPALAWPLRALEDQAYVSAMLCENYAPLLARLNVPTTVLVGDRPLHGPRPAGWPSLVDPETLAELSSHPMVTLRTVSGGHDLVRDNPAAFYQALGDAALRLPQSPAAAQPGSDPRSFPR